MADEEGKNWREERWQISMTTEWDDNYCTVTLDHAADVKAEEILELAVKLAGEVGMFPADQGEFTLKLS